MGRAAAAVTGATTAKQRTFAKLVAQGEPQVKAYDKAYAKRGGKSKMTRQVDSSKLAAKPNVRAMIAEYEAQLVPIGDVRACKQRMLANIQSLAYNSPDEKVRLAASIKLHELMEAQEERETAGRRPVTIDALITEISEMQPPPVLELETIDGEKAEPAEETAEAEGETAAEPSEVEPD